MAFNVSRKTVLRTLIGTGLISAAPCLSGCSEGFFGKTQSVDNRIEPELDDSSGQFHQAVVSESAHATRIGDEVMRAGGNAIDAAVAMGYALSVTLPYAIGIGGGGGMLVHDIKTGQSQFLDFYDAAPLSNLNSSSTSCVPGFVRGMACASQEWGTISHAEAIQPAIELAQGGFEVSEHLADVFASYSNFLSKIPCFSIEGETLYEEDRLIQKDLAETLKLIRDEGPDAFYAGSLAEAIAKKSGYTIDDLRSYEPKLRAPLTASCFGHRLHAAPPPFSGGTTIQLLKILEMLGTPSADEDGATYLADLYRATSISAAARAQCIADPDFEQVDGNQFVSDDFISNLLETDGAGYIDDSEDVGLSTTAYSVLDRNGKLVSVTSTLGNYFGNRTYLNGFFLNNHMGWFAKGGINKYVAGKRPRTHISPCIVEGDAGILSLGTPGGALIPNILAGTLFDHLVGGVPIDEAVHKNRAIFSRGILLLETSDDRDDLVDDAHASLYSVSRKEHDDYFGSVQVVGCEMEGASFSVSDDRREGNG